MALTIVLILILFICLAMLWTEGMWGNAVTLINTVISCIVATNCYEAVVAFGMDNAPTYTYVLDYLCLWGAFAACFAVLRSATDAISRHKVKFKKPVEQAGRALFAFATGWVIVCFTTYSLHTAPLGENPFRASLHHDGNTKNFLGLGPDIMWLAFAQSRSKGALSRADESGPDGVRVYDPDSTFMARYASRRKKLETIEGLRTKGQ